MLWSLDRCQFAQNNCHSATDNGKLSPIQFLGARRRHHEAFCVPSKAQPSTCKATNAVLAPSDAVYSARQKDSFLVPDLVIVSGVAETDCARKTIVKGAQRGREGKIPCDTGLSGRWRENNVMKMVIVLTLVWRGMFAGGQGGALPFGD